MGLQNVRIQCFSFGVRNIFQCQRYYKHRMSMATISKATNNLFGIDIDQGTVYFANSAVKDERKLLGGGHHNASNNPAAELSNGIFYTFCNTNLPVHDLVKQQIYNVVLQERLSALPIDGLWNSFLFCMLKTEGNNFHSGFTIKFNHNSGDCTEERTKNILDIAISLGLTSISRLVPSKQGFLVDVISCNTNESLDHFEILSVKYPSYHPSFDYGHSIYKSFEEAQNILELAESHISSLQAIQALQDLANNFKTKPSLVPEERPHPFIVVEGLDAVGKSTLVTNLAKRLGAEKFCTPPSTISPYRKWFVKQCQPICRAFYSLGNYLIAEDIKEAMMKCPVVLDRFWYSSAAYAIATEAQCGDESNIPPKGHAIYQWPCDLLKPSAVIFLVLNEEQRKERMRMRGDPVTDEEELLGKSQLFRRRLIAAYKNMNDPACIIIDASKGKEEVCEDVLMALKENRILT